MDLEPSIRPSRPRPDGCGTLPIAEESSNSAPRATAAEELVVYDFTVCTAILVPSAAAYGSGK